MRIKSRVALFRVSFETICLRFYRVVRIEVFDLLKSPKTRMSQLGNLLQMRSMEHDKYSFRSRCSWRSRSGGLYTTQAAILENGPASRFSRNHIQLYPHVFILSVFKV